MALEVPTFVPFWLDANDPLAWDTLILGGDVYPGIANVEGSGVVRALDVKKAKGNDGATIKDEGNELAKLTITLLIYNTSDWVLLQELLPRIHPRKAGGPRQPLEIIHPKTTLLGIQYVYVTGIPFPEFDKSKQMLTVTIEAIEWAPAPKAPKKAAGTGDGDEIKSRAHTFGDVGGDSDRVDEDGYHVTPQNAIKKGMGDAVNENLGGD